MWVSFGARRSRLLEEAKKVAADERVALKQLITVAVAEKLSAIRTESYFRERSARAGIGRRTVNRYRSRPTAIRIRMPSKLPRAEPYNNGVTPRLSRSASSAGDVIAANCGEHDARGY